MSRRANGIGGLGPSTLLDAVCGRPAVYLARGIRTHDGTRSWRPTAWRPTCRVCAGGVDGQWRRSGRTWLETMHAEYGVPLDFVARIEL